MHRKDAAGRGEPKHTRERDGVRNVDGRFGIQLEEDGRWMKTSGPGSQQKPNHRCAYRYIARRCSCSGCRCAPRAKTEFLRLNLEGKL